MVGSGALVVSDVVWIQHALHTFGGRRIEPPRGGEHRRPPTLGAFVIEVVFWQAFLAFLAFVAFAMEVLSWQAFWPFFAFLGFGPKISKKSLQNLPKSSFGGSKIEPGASKIEPGALQDTIFKDI